jgi:hypothetical protein
MVKPTNTSQQEIDEINQKLAQFIGEGSSYGFDGVDIDDELPTFANPDDYELLDDSFNDIDFSSFKGDTKQNLHKINKTVSNRKPTKRYVKKQNIKPKPLTKEFGVNRKATIIGSEQRKMGKVIVPNNRKVIVEGVSSFMLSDSKDNDTLRNIGYYKGKKQQQLVLIFNNNNPNNFVLELFNPSMPLDYLYSTSANLNSQIQVAGGNVEYSDVLFNILANPLMITSATFTISGPLATQQQAVALQINDKFVNGVTKIDPLNLALQIDNMQVEGNNISFSFLDVLHKPFIPDGMSVINYTVLAGNTVTMAFFYEQKSIKKLFFEEARKINKRV